MNVSYQAMASIEEFAGHTSTRIRDAFYELLSAVDYAHALDTTVWDFAVEIRWLRRLKLSNNDLRWLVRAGFLEYAEEVQSQGDQERSFRQLPKLMFSKDTCFVLTSEGAMAARALCDGKAHAHAEQPDRDGTVDQNRFSPLTSSPKLVVPKWDRMRQELRVGPVVVKRFKVPAPSQEAILEAFEEEAWTPRIDDPLSPRDDQSPKRRLQETIRSLNRNQKTPLVHFLGDGSGEGVLWQHCNGQAAMADCREY